MYVDYKMDLFAITNALMAFKFNRCRLLMSLLLENAKTGVCTNTKH